MSKSKTFKSLSLASATIVASAFASVAYADDVATPTTDNGQATNQASTTQKSILEQAQATVEYTKEVATTAETAVATAEADLVVATKQVTTAETNVSTSSQALAQADKAILTATAVSAAADIEAGHADSTVDSAKDALTQAGGQDMAKAKKDLTRATEVAKAADDVRANSQADVDAQEIVASKATDAVADNNNSVAVAKNAVNIKTQDVADAHEALITANQTINTKEAESKVKLAELDANLKNALTGKRTIITVSVNPTEILNGGPHNGRATLISSGTPREETITIPENMVQNGKVIYTPNKDAIAKYLVDYINELRKQNGISTKTELTTDSDALAFAQARAQENADRRRLGHDTKLHAPRPYTENVANGYVYNTQAQNDMSVYSDKEYAYRLITGWTNEYGNLYGGHGHFNLLLYAKGPIAFGSALQETTTAHKDLYGNDFKEYQNILHFLSPNKYDATEDDYSFVKETDTADGLALVLANGKRAVGLPEVTFNYRIPTIIKDPSAIKNAQEAYDSYKDQWQVEKDALNKALATAATTLTARTTDLETTKADLSAKEVALETAKADLEKAENNLRFKKVALKDAINASNQAAIAKAKAEKAFADAQNARIAFDNAVVRAKVAHQKANDAKIDLRNAQDNREHRLNEYQDAEHTLATAKDNLEVAKNALVTARANAKAAHDAYDRAQTKLSVIKAATKTVEPTKTVEVAKPIETTKTSAITVVKAGTSAKAAPVTHNTDAFTTKALPKTGDDASFGLTAVSLGLLSGAVVARRRRTKK